MIRYIQRKRIDLNKFGTLILESEKTNQFTNKGPAKKQLEKKLENILQIKNGKSILCVTNGTLALHAIYLFLLRRSKDIKIVSPSFTFPSCKVGFDQVEIVDIDPNTYTMPLSNSLIENYDVFVITNLFGTLPNNLEDWTREVECRGKTLIFDNASSPMSTFNGVNFCNLGDFSFGSLHHTKYMGFGEGGFLVCPSEYYNEFEEIIGFGFKEGVIKRKHNHLSSNFKMSDIQAASISQHIDGYNFANHLSLQKYFLKKIKERCKNVTPFNYSEGVFYGNMPLLFNRAVSIEKFRDNNIEAQKYYYPLEEHRFSLDLFERIINLPLNGSMTIDDVDEMVRVVTEISGE